METVLTIHLRGSLVVSREVRMKVLRPAPSRGRSAGVLSIPILFVWLAVAGAHAQDQVHASRNVGSREQEYSAFFAALDGSWLQYRPGSAAFTALDSLALEDLAEMLAMNPELRLRMWSSAPDDPMAAPAGGDSARPRWTGAGSRLARSRSVAVRDYLVAAGVPPAQLETQVEAPDDLPHAFRWSAGGTFFFVAEHGATLTSSQAWVRIRAAPGSEVFFVPLAIADRQPALLCQPPAITRRGQANADSLVDATYPPRPIVGVSRDAAGVIRTRSHNIDPGGRPDTLDFTRELPDARCH
jgi:hypothetical protein